MKIAIPGVLILIGVVGLIAMGISQGAIPEVDVESLQSGDYDGQQVRLLGVIHKIETDTRPMAAHGPTGPQTSASSMS